MATWVNLLDIVYPVGSVYFSYSSTSPASRFGGSWTQINGGRFLCAAGSGYTAGATGGADWVTLSVSQMPSHQHHIQENSEGSWQRMCLWRTNASYGSEWWMPAGGGTDASLPQMITDLTGGTLPHENRPPYIVVYIWRRTA